MLQLRRWRACRRRRRARDQNRRRMRRRRPRWMPLLWSCVEGLDTHDTKLRHGDIGTIRSPVRLGPVETQAVSCGARKKGGCTRVLWGECELRHNPDLRIDCRTYSVRKGKKMSVHSAILVHEISTAWLRNAFVAALVLVLLLILVP